MTKRLYRSEKNAKLFGICGGVAEYFGVDPTVVRVGALVGGLVTGIIPFLFVYVIAYLVIPIDESYAEVVK